MAVPLSLRQQLGGTCHGLIQVFVLDDFTLGKTLPGELGQLLADLGQDLPVLSRLGGLVFEVVFQIEALCALDARGEMTFQDVIICRH